MKDEKKIKLWTLIFCPEVQEFLDLLTELSNEVNNEDIEIALLSEPVETVIA